MHDCTLISARDTRSTLRKNENEENGRCEKAAAGGRGDIAFRRLLFLILPLSFSVGPFIPFPHRLPPGFARLSLK